MPGTYGEKGHALTVAVAGAGAMGAGMVASLCRAGITTMVWDRDQRRSAPLAEVGAVVAPSLPEAVQSADVVITMVVDGDAVRSLAVEHGMLAAMTTGAVWAQMSTVGVAATDALVALTAERRPDVTFVDAPVSGSRGPAERGELFVLASGPTEDIDVLRPVFDAVGRRTVWLGHAGRGSRLKLVLNTWLAFLIEGLAETAGLADALGITPRELEGALADGPLAAPAAMAKLAKIENDDYRPEFSLALALKDLDLALAAADRRLPVMSAIADQWHVAVSRGLGALDVSAATLALDGASVPVRA